MCWASGLSCSFWCVYCLFRWPSLSIIKTTVKTFWITKNPLNCQKEVGETLSRITPTASLIYLATNLTQTGKIKKHNYFEAADRYYGALHADLFSKIVDHASVRSYHPDDLDTIAQPPPIAVPSLDETLRHALVDVLCLCFFAVVLTTLAFLKFFRSDI